MGAGRFSTPASSNGKREGRDAGLSSKRRDGDTRLPPFASDVISNQHHIEKGGLRMTVYFQHHRQRGPVDALQTRLQG
jgi:hypothetical protein